MLEIVLGSLILIGVVAWLLRRPKQQGPAGDKPAGFVCPHCNEKDCHCERRS